MNYAMDCAGRASSGAGSGGMCGGAGASETVCLEVLQSYGTHTHSDL